MRTAFLSRLHPREVDKLLRSMGRYTRFVLFGKYFLAILALALIALLVGLPLLERDDDMVRVIFNAAEKTAPEVPKMTHPRFQGTDSRNQPFTISADSAMQEGEEEVLLSMLNADITLEGGNWLSITASQGRLNMAQKRLQLTGQVQLFYDQGYEFRTEAANIDMERKTAEGDSPIEGQGPFGSLKADGFRLYGAGERLEFLHAVRLTLYPQPKPR